MITGIFTNNTKETVKLDAGMLLHYSNTPYCKDIIAALSDGGEAREVIIYKGASMGITSCLIPGVHGYVTIQEVKALKQNT